MSKNYLTYPLKTMRITQSYNGTVSHKPHVTGNPFDYPWDEGGEDTGRSWCYCPCDKMKVKRIYGVGGAGTNTLWLESTSKVLFADGTSDYVTMLITHPNDDDLKKIKVGQTFKRGQQICREGKDGATAYHFHFSAGRGRYEGNGWTRNSNGKYVLTTTGGTFKPEQLFFIDKSFTKIIDSKGLSFKEKPKETTVKGYTDGNYRVKADLLHVRKGAGTSYPKVKFKDMSADAQKKIKALNGGKAADGYVKGLAFTALQVKGKWGRTPSGWVCLKYCEKI